MYVQFTKDYRNFKENQIIQTFDIMGYELVKKGYANEVKNCVRTSNIVIAKYINPNAPTSSLNFSNSLFLYINDHPSANGETGIFVDLITNEEVFPDNHIIFNKSCTHSRVVSMNSAHSFYEHFEKDLQSKGYDVEYLSEDDLNYYYEKLNPSLGEEFVATFE